MTEMLTTFATIQEIFREGNIVRPSEMTGESIRDKQFPKKQRKKTI
jgi:hypothetical protein